MARTAPNHHGTRQSSRALDRARADRKKKDYEIRFESVIQKRKQLRSSVSTPSTTVADWKLTQLQITYSAQSPPGYTFVPFGNPDLTDYIKERCRTRSLEAFTVTV
jgi:hypothetical protein